LLLTILTRARAKSDARISTYPLLSCYVESERCSFHDALPLRSRRHQAYARAADVLKYSLSLGLGQATGIDVSYLSYRPDAT